MQEVHMKTDVLLMRFVGLFLAACLSFMLAGCSTPYMQDRKRDALDMVTLTLGNGLGVQAHAGPMQGGLLADEDLGGIRAGEQFGRFYVFSDYARRKYADTRSGTPDLKNMTFNFLLLGLDMFDGGRGRAQETSIRDRHKEVQGALIGPLWIPGQWIDNKSNEPAWPFIAQWTQLEATVGLWWSMRVGVNPGEMLDFLLGWATLDLYGDDAESKKARHAKEKAAKGLSSDGTPLKSGHPTFLIVAPVIGPLPGDLFKADATNAVSRPLDLLAWNGDIRDGWRDSATTNADLRIDAAFDADRKHWNVTYSVTNGPGGVVLSDTMLCEAPADGYAPSVSATFTNGYDLKKYVYVKSRNPEVYSRVMFVHGAEGGAVPALRVSCKTWTNPYGDRSLEFDERADGAGIAGGLAAAAKAALASGKYPERPDVGRLAEEALAARQKWMDEQERYQKSPEYLAKAAAQKRQVEKSLAWQKVLDSGKGLAPEVMSAMRKEAAGRAERGEPGYPVVARAVTGEYEPVPDADVTVHFTRDDARRTALPHTQERRTNAAGDFHFFIAETGMPVRVWVSAGRVRTNVSNSNFDPAKADTYVRRPPLFWFPKQPGGSAGGPP
jgi:hypothetical protein